MTTAHVIPQEQPNDDRAERALLCTVLLNPEHLIEAQEIVTAADFYRTAHKFLWDTLTHMSASETQIDNVTVADELKRVGRLEAVGGASYIAELLMELAAPVQPKRYADIVREKAVLRQLIHAGHAAMARAYDCESSQEIARDVEQVLFNIVCARRSGTWRTSNDVMIETMSYVDRVSRRTEGLLGITSGLADLDAILGGWHATDLVIIGGRPSMGKTAFALQASLAAARIGKTVGVISLEMGMLQIGLRYLAMGADVDVRRLRLGQIGNDEWRSIATASQDLSLQPIFLDDAASTTHETIRAKARQLKVQHGLDILIIDYLQLVQLSKGGKRHEGLGEISRALKLLAKELDITVIALSQVSREVERRDDKRPILADLRESGSLEQDADVVIFLYRDEVYNRESIDAGIAEVIVRKQRNGPIGEVRTAFRREQAQFADLAEAHAQGGM